MLARNYAAGGRLNLQYFLVREVLGYSLHPDIPVTPNMKICDIATGTGIWILDLSLKLPETVQFEGYDLSADQFPPASSLPSNIKFGTFDASRSIPDHLVGKFDVVHVGFLIAVVNGNFSQWMQNLMKMLKPGGYLQWNEGNLVDLFERIKQNPYDPAQFPGLAQLAKTVTGHADVRIEKTLWASNLGEGFEKEGLTDVKCKEFDPPARLGRAFSENTLLILEETAKQAGRQDVLDLCVKCGEDLKKGGLYSGLHPVEAIGRKPE